MGTPRHTLSGALLPVLIGLPVAAGFGATALGAAGLVPGLPVTAGNLLDWPGLATSLLLTLRIGFGATALSVAGALLVAASVPASRLGRVLAAPLLAAPHAALAIGLAFLVAPSGFLARVAGATFSFATVGDPWGIAEIGGLWLKETPFLFLMAVAAQGQAEAAGTLRVAASLGHAPFRSWLVGVLPRIWPQMRLPVLTVLAFSLSATDVAIVLGPQTPPTLAVQAQRWALDPDLSRWPLAGQAALVLVALVLFAAVAMVAAERGAAVLGRLWLRHGGRGRWSVDVPALALAVLLATVGGAGLAVLVGWAGAGSWRFPSLLPTGWSMGRLIQHGPDLAGPAATTLWLALVTVGVSLPVVVAVLVAGRTQRLAWVPLLLPQLGFLSGVQTLLVTLRVDGSALALVWAHATFVLPYVLFTLRGPWSALDRRYGMVAAGLGASPGRVLLRITLPMLMRPLLTAAAVGFAVSAGLYLPTLFAGAGRIATLATEAVTLAAGGDRRVLAATALAQAALPFAAFALLLLRR